MEKLSRVTHKTDKTENIEVLSNFPLVASDI